MTPKEALRHSKLFSSLSEREIAEVAAIVVERTVSSGETLIREGDEANSLFILEEGSVDVLKRLDNNESSRITELAEGAIFGEMAFLGHPPRTAGVVSHGSAKVLELRYSALEQLASQDPVLGVKLFRTVALSLNEKLKNTTEHLLPLIASARMAALGQMTANIAHEINNPLQVVRSLSDRLAERVRESAESPGNKEEICLWAEKISANASRIGRVISGLTTVSRNGAADPIFSVDPEKVIHETLEFCEQRLNHFSIQTEVILPSIKSRMLCRSVQASQVLLNLLNNAMDAMDSVKDPAGRWIKVEVANGPQDVKISVTDSGSGIPPDVAQRIFRPFFTTKGLGHGTGLGLSIARQVIESNGGKLELDTLSSHTRFEITVPRAAD